MKTHGLPHYYTAHEIAGLVDRSEDLIQCLVRCGFHPPWIWKPGWPEPRWPISSLSPWLEIVNTLNPAGMPANPPELLSPERLFNHGEKRKAPMRIGAFSMRKSKCQTRPSL